MCGLLRVPQIGDYFRTGVHGNHPTYHGKDLECVPGNVGPKTLIGPIQDFDSYRRDTDEDCYAGFRLCKRIKALFIMTRIIQSKLKARFR